MKLLVTKPEDSMESRMDVHQNAKLPPHCRELLVSRVLAGRRRREVAREFGVTERTVGKWVSRFRAEGVAVVADPGRAGALHAEDAESQRQHDVVIQGRIDAAVEGFEVVFEYAPGLDAFRIAADVLCRVAGHPGAGVPLDVARCTPERPGARICIESASIKMHVIVCSTALIVGTVRVVSCSSRSRPRAQGSSNGCRGSPKESAAPDAPLPEVAERP
jgi:transposase-like protein